MATPFQPTLPAPIDFTEAELNFHDEEPPGLYPDNQNSNWGLIRKIFSDQNQDFASQLEMLYLEAFVATSSTYLDRWERDVSLPAAPAGISLPVRRQNVLSRLGKGPFTRPRRDALIENYIQVTFGEPAAFYPEGLSLEGGIPLFAEQATASALYRVYEDVRNFSFEIWIQNTTSPDIAALNRELARMSPYSYSIDNNRSIILDYFRTVRNLQPNAYWRMGELTDSSGYANTLALTTGPTVIAAPGLLANASIAGGSGAYLFNGSTGGLTAPFAPSLNLHDNFSISMLVRLDVAPAGAAFARLIHQANAITLRVTNDRTVTLSLHPVIEISKSSVPLTLGTTHRLVITKNGPESHFYIDGVDQTTVLNPDNFHPDGVNPVNIGWNGSGEVFNGAIDEVALFDYELTQEQAIMLDKTSRGLV